MLLSYLQLIAFLTFVFVLLTDLKMSSPKAPHSVVTESPEQDVRSSNGQTFIQAPEAPQLVVSECPEEHVRLLSGQIRLQAVESQEMQPSSVRASRITSTTQCTSSLPQTTMSPGIQVSQTSEQISHYSEPSTPSTIQPWYRHLPPRNLQPPPPPAHQQSRMNKQFLNEPSRPRLYIEDPLLLHQRNPFTSDTQSGIYHQRLYNNPMLPQMYPGSPSSGPYYPSQPLDLPQHIRGIHSTTPRCEYQWVPSENITRNVTCRPFPAYQQTAYSMHNREVHPRGFSAHLQQSRQQQSLHHPQPFSVYAGLPIQGIQALSNQPMYKTQPSLPHPRSQLQPSTLAVHNIQAAGIQQNQPMNKPPPRLSIQSLSERQPGMSQTNRGTLYYKICTRM